MLWKQVTIRRLDVQNMVVMEESNMNLISDHGHRFGRPVWKTSPSCPNWKMWLLTWHDKWIIWESVAVFETFRAISDADNIVIYVIQKAVGLFAYFFVFVEFNYAIVHEPSDVNAEFEERGIA